MPDAELYSWLFVSKEWDKLRRMPVPDKGFEERFREYICTKISFDSMSNVRDMGLGFSHETLSGVPHELDLICLKNKELLVFELKHYETSNLSKEIVFTFLGKMIDFYFRNLEIYSAFKISMTLVTINRNIDDSIRKLCLAYGIKLIDASLMTMNVMNYCLRSLYGKISEQDAEFKKKVEGLIGKIDGLREHYDYSFSDFFRHKNKRVEIDPTLLKETPTDALGKIYACNRMFEKVKEEWKSRTE
jgi:hypothetical protein